MGAGEDFLIKTNYNESIVTDQMRGIDVPPLEPEFTGTIIPLPDPDECTRNDVDVSNAIESRESIRNYKNQSLSSAELSYLLWCTQGVKWIFEDCTFRNVPSAGARHAIDTYVVVKNISDLKSGLYKFLALDHTLGVVREEEFISDLVYRASLSQEFVKEAAVCFIWVADSYRMTWKYGERGFRDIFIEAGHICQNLYLSAEVVECGVCAIGAFNDGEINDLLDLDGTKRFVVYMAAVGKKVPETDYISKSLLTRM